MKIASIILLLLYSALTAVTLFVKDDTCKRTKWLAATGVASAIVHTTLYFVAQSHWGILLASLACMMAYAIANGLLLQKPHILHWVIRFAVSAVIFILFVI